MASSVCSQLVAASGDENSANNKTGFTDSVRVEYQDGRLSVSASQAPIVEVMLRVGEQAGIQVTAYGDFAGLTVSQSFSDLQLGPALKKLLRDVNAIVTYRDPGQSNENSAISKIFLLGSGSSNADPIRVSTLQPGLESSMRSDEIQSGDADSRLAVIERSEGLTDSITLENLAFSLNHDPDTQVRMKALSALANIGGSAAVDVLESGLGDYDPEVRKKTVEILGGLDDERIPLWLGQVLMGDSSPEVRLVAVQSIARKQGDTARIFLEAAIGDSSSEVREAAQNFLGQSTGVNQ